MEEGVTIGHSSLEKTAVIEHPGPIRRGDEIGNTSNRLSPMAVATIAMDAPTLRLHLPRPPSSRLSSVEFQGTTGTRETTDPNRPQLLVAEAISEMTETPIGCPTTVLHQSVTTVLRGP